MTEQPHEGDQPAPADESQTQGGKADTDESTPGYVPIADKERAHREDAERLASESE